MQPFKVRNWRRVAISMEKSSEEHVLVDDRGLVLTLKVRVLKT